MKSFCNERNQIFYFGSESCFRDLCKARGLSFNKFSLDTPFARKRSKEILILGFMADKKTFGSMADKKTKYLVQVFPKHEQLFVKGLKLKGDRAK